MTMSKEDWEALAHEEQQRLAERRRLTARLAERQQTCQCALATSPPACCRLLPSLAEELFCFPANALAPNPLNTVAVAADRQAVPLLPPQQQQPRRSSQLLRMVSSITAKRPTASAATAAAILEDEQEHSVKHDGHDDDDDDDEGDREGCGQHATAELHAHATAIQRLVRAAAARQLVRCRALAATVQRREACRVFVEQRVLRPVLLSIQRAVELYSEEVENNEMACEEDLRRDCELQTKRQMLAQALQALAFGVRHCLRKVSVQLPVILSDASGAAAVVAVSQWLSTHCFSWTSVRSLQLRLPPDQRLSASLLAQCCRYFPRCEDALYREGEPADADVGLFFRPFVASARRQRQWVARRLRRERLAREQEERRSKALARLGARRPANVNGNRSVVNGNSSVVTGNSSVVNGNRSVVNGNRSVVNGNSSVVTGNSSVVNGNSSVVNGNSSVTSSVNKSNLGRQSTSTISQSVTAGRSHSHSRAHTERRQSEQQRAPRDTDRVPDNVWRAQLQLFARVFPALEDDNRVYEAFPRPLGERETTIFVHSAAYSLQFTFQHGGGTRVVRWSVENKQISK
jgi:hypothetical protein